MATHIYVEGDGSTSKGTLETPGPLPAQHEYGTLGHPGWPSVGHGGDCKARCARCPIDPAQPHVRAPVPSGLLLDGELTMRQTDIMDWVLERLEELEATGATPAGKAAPKAGPRPSLPVPSTAKLREAIAQPHVSSFGDIWAEFPEAPVEKLRKALWALVEAGEVELDTAGGVRLTSQEEVAFVEEVQSIDGVPVKGRSRATQGLKKSHRDRFARTKVVRVRAHNQSRGARNQAKRDNRGKGRR